VVYEVLVTVSYMGIVWQIEHGKVELCVTVSGPHDWLLFTRR
jgi:hypothetical protein